MQPSDQSEDASCVFLAAEPDPGTALWLFFLYHEMKHSLLSEAQLWQKASVWSPGGVDDIRFLIFFLLFSLTAPDRLYFFFFFFAQRTLEESEHLTL